MSPFHDPPAAFADAGLTAFLLSFLNTRDAFALSAVMAPNSADFRVAMKRYLSSVSVSGWDDDDGEREDRLLWNVPLAWLECAARHGVWELPSSGRLRVSIAQVAETATATASPRAPVFNLSDVHEVKSRFIPPVVRILRSICAN